MKKYAVITLLVLVAAAFTKGVAYARETENADDRGAPRSEVLIAHPSGSDDLFKNEMGFLRDMLEAGGDKGVDSPAEVAELEPGDDKGIDPAIVPGTSLPADDHSQDSITSQPADDNGENQPANAPDDHPSGHESGRSGSTPPDNHGGSRGK